MVLWNKDWILWAKLPPILSCRLKRWLQRRLLALPLSWLSEPGLHTQNSVGFGGKLMLTQLEDSKQGGCSHCQGA